MRLLQDKPFITSQELSVTKGLHTPKNATAMVTVLVMRASHDAPEDAHEDAKQDVGEARAQRALGEVTPRPVLAQEVDAIPSCIVATVCM